MVLCNLNEWKTSVVRETHFLLHLHILAVLLCEEGFGVRKLRRQREDSSPSASVVSTSASIAGYFMCKLTSIQSPSAGPCIILRSPIPKKVRLVFRRGHIDCYGNERSRAFLSRPTSARVFSCHRAQELSTDWERKWLYIRSRRLVTSLQALAGKKRYVSK